MSDALRTLCPVHDELNSRSNALDVKNQSVLNLDDEARVLHRNNTEFYVELLKESRIVPRTGHDKMRILNLEVVLVDLRYDLKKLNVHHANNLEPAWEAEMQIAIKTLHIAELQNDDAITKSKSMNKKQSAGDVTSAVEKSIVDKEIFGSKVQDLITNVDMLEKQLHISGHSAWARPCAQHEKKTATSIEWVHKTTTDSPKYEDAASF